MKKLILAGIVIIIGCLIFIIIQQNSSQADIGRNIYDKAYPVLFGDWVMVYLSAILGSVNVTGDMTLTVSGTRIEGKHRFVVYGGYHTELGKQLYQKYLPELKESIRVRCKHWTEEGYPISLNDFEFKVSATY